MTRGRRIGRILGGLVMVLCAVAAGFALYVRSWLHRSLPALNGTVHAAGLREGADIDRDVRGIPTLRGSSDEDVVFALGYAHAQDRFVEMEFSRRAPAGRISELVGPPAIELDRRLRRLGLARAAERSVAALKPESRRLLEAYAAGVNAWITANAGAMPPEWDLLHLHGGPASPEPWRPADSLAIVKFLSFLLDGNYLEELQRAELTDKLGAESAAALIEAVGGEEAPIITASAAPTRTTPLMPTFRDADADPALAHATALAARFGAGREIGSNSWVIAGSRTKSGHPLLANDPHLAVQNPSQWYAARLAGPTLAVAGMTIPGVPVVIVGKNAHVAWGITALHGDVQDLFVERADPADPHRYAVADEMRAYTERTEEIRVAGQQAVEQLNVRSTRHGPVIEDRWHDRGPLALSWTALADDDTTYDALLAFDRARNAGEFREAGRAVIAPVVNIVYADDEGHIGYLAPGRIPIRQSGDGSLPTDGAPADAVWSRYIPFEELPQIVDPQEGFIVAANQRVAGAGYPHFLARSWAASFRARRIRELITSHQKIDMEDLATFHADVTSVAARALLPKLLAVAASADDLPARRLLDGWDGSLRADSAAAMLYSAWIVEMRAHLLDDEVGAELAEGTVTVPVLIDALADPKETFCDDRRTPARETCADFLGKSLHAAVQRLEKSQGKEPTGWRLDRAAHVRFGSRIASPLPIIGPLFTRVVSGQGDSTTVRVFTFNGDFRAGAVSTMFADSDLSAPGELRVTETMGQSSHPLSPHFDDMLPAWRAARAARMDPPDAAVATLHLVR